VAQGSFELTAVESTRIESDYNSDESYGESYQLKVGRYTTPKMRSFIKFDLDLIPDLVVEKIELQIYSIGGVGSPEIELHNVVNTWDENVLTYDNSFVFNDLISSQVIDSPGLKSFDVTEELLDKTGIYSFGLKANNEAIEENYRLFLSDENPVNDPRLIITYTDHEPVITSTNVPSQFFEGESYVLSFEASDLDDDITSYKIKIDDVLVSDTTEYTFNLDFEKAGTYTLTFEVEDITGYNDTEEFSIEVYNVQNIVVNEFSTLANWIELYSPIELNLDGCSVHSGGLVAQLSGTALEDSFILIEGFNLENEITIYCNDVLVDYVDLDWIAHNEGESISRKEDGYDTDSSSDFVVTQPTPGSANPLGYNIADTNLDGCISFTEFLNFVELWKLSDDLTIQDLLEVVDEWKTSPIC
jgi:hypothetical protein